MMRSMHALCLFALGASQEGPEEQPPTLACGSSVEALAQTGGTACSNLFPSPRGISRSGELRRQLDSEQPRPCWKQGSQLLRGIVREAHNLTSYLPWTAILPIRIRHWDQCLFGYLLYCVQGPYCCTTKYGKGLAPLGGLRGAYLFNLVAERSFDRGELRR